MNLRNSLFWKTFALIALVVALVSTLLLYLLHQRQHLVAQQVAFKFNGPVNQVVKQETPAQRHLKDNGLTLARVFAVDGLAFVQQFLGVLVIAILALALVKRAFIPGNSQPFERIKYGFGGFLGRADLVGIFYAQHQGAVQVPGHQVIVQGGPGAADVQIPGRAGRETNPYFTCSGTIGHNNLFMGSTPLEIGHPNAILG